MTEGRDPAGPRPWAMSGRWPRSPVGSGLLATATPVTRRGAQGRHEPLQPHLCRAFICHHNCRLLGRAARERGKEGAPATASAWVDAFSASPAGRGVSKSRPHQRMRESPAAGEAARPICPPNNMKNRGVDPRRADPPNRRPPGPPRTVGVEFPRCSRRRSGSSSRSSIARTEAGTGGRRLHAR